MKVLVSSKMSSGKIKDKINQKIAQTAGALIGVVKPEKQDLLPREFELSPHVYYKRFGSTHYGIMVPDLPEPLRYLSWASVIGYIGFAITDSEYKISLDGKGDTASLVHGTALSTSDDAYQTYSIKRDLTFQRKPFSVQFKNHTSLTQHGNNYLLETDRDDLKVELILEPTRAITWFAHSELYKHFSTLMRYKGCITQQGIKKNVDGICTLESWKAVSTSLLRNTWLVENIQLPVKIFSYQVINIDEKQQLLLVFVCYQDQPIITSVYYRHVDGTSIQYNGEAHFEVMELKHKPEITPDGFLMDVPKSFAWSAYHNDKKILDINANVDTEYCYGLAAGFVSAYQWQGEFCDQKVSGRGYLEYIDRR